MISLVNHYNYRTAAFDLGIYTNSLYEYSHYFNNHHPFGYYSVTNFLGDHFSLYTMILSPLSFLFGSYTLLFVQIASIVIGGLGVYKIVSKWFPGSFLAETALFHFLAFYGVFSALAADYHDNVVAAMIVPWFLYYVFEKRFSRALVMAILVCIGKENMPLWMAFICGGLCLLYRHDKPTRAFCLTLAIGSVLFFIIVLKVIMPLFILPGFEGSHLTYSILGSNPLETVLNFITKTRVIFTALFTNIFQPNYLDGIKEETYLCLLFSGGLALLIQPEYLVMLLPIFAQKMFNDDMAKWGINSHYSIEFVPIVIIAFYSSLRYFSNKEFKMAVSLLFCLLTYSTTFCKMYNRKSEWYSEAYGNVFSQHHYFSFFNQADVEKTISKIPDHAGLSALSSFAPHVALRKDITMFPDIHKADYIFVAESPHEYPLQGEQLHNEIMKYKTSADWETVSEINGVYLFRKKN
ncbi:MAG: DUF2079 domain-containing protein [Bacteroidetes bacterium]|nr:DUF2079 domain-containing protein [Bacteroidota bacterium]